ncbi:MAG: hypothetical protein JRN26_01635 [Nitrososphaerota archaeon]|jgi:hypothetical protein|nr:hypothetical protein [Nitrososphaerota archaeon]MDG6930247.1 hypothetical protein [Nitrososphaerota archaeon]MDG6932629.1 hypothetical protein [Nitrososphaerota archaeon]MDG6935579.1 hypothetical protein [Nitrososphaerota archaeon]MDG6944023.1 hypothetical protein [Nitrososphaerota archaeon]
MHEDSSFSKYIRTNLYSMPSERVQLLAVGVLSFLAITGVAVRVPVGPSWSNYSDGSWATGIIVPQGAGLRGGNVNWSMVNNITSLFRVPNISVTDRPIYIIMSAMTSNGSVIQVAVGLYNNSNYWKGYAMYILNPGEVPQNYVQVSLEKNLRILAGNMVSMALYSKNGSWCFSIRDLSTDGSVEGRFNASLSSGLSQGGQYVFALESYSYSYQVFDSMGNLALYAIFISGEPVINGWYIYSGWTSFPLFLVGGSSPPSFMSIRQTTNGTFIWSAS